MSEEIPPFSSPAADCKDRKGYNERLFSRGLRAKLHTARFRWTQKVTANLPHESLLELGCFDGRLLEYVQPRKYVGIDAGWEGGIDAAIAKYGNDSTKQFIRTTDAAALAPYQSGAFDLCVALETLEHIPPDILESYLKEVARICKHFVITVPNEKGPVFLAKWIVKRTMLRDHDPEPYTLREVINATLGRTHLVQRGEHKGFDYAVLLASLAKHFRIHSVVGIPVGPPALAFSIGIVAEAF